MALMETMTTSLTQKGSQPSQPSSISTSTTNESITPPLLTHGVSYHSVTSIPNLLNYDGQTGSGIRPNRLIQSDLPISTSSRCISSPHSPSDTSQQLNYQYGKHQRSGSLDFLADAAIDLNKNQEEFVRILKRFAEYKLEIEKRLHEWDGRNIKDLMMAQLTNFAADTKAILRCVDRLLELKSINDWQIRKPQLPSIDQLRSELQKPMVEFQFPMRVTNNKALFNVTVKNRESQHPGASASSINKSGMRISHKATKSDGALPITHTFKVDKVKLKKRNSISQQRKISIAAGDGTESCRHCHETVTPEWRRGPYGNRTLCNACGLFYCKLIKKFSIREANTLMHYRKSNGPEDRRVPETLSVPESFIESLEKDSTLDGNFNVQ